jgi:hypothetical protein
MKNKVIKYLYIASFYLAGFLVIAAFITLAAVIDSITF